MSELSLGTRIKTNDGAKGTLVRFTDGAYLAYLDTDGLTSLFPGEFEVFVQPEVRRINDLQELIDFKRKHKLLHDWHEPDNADITAEVRGTYFDNAGFWGGNTFGGNKEELYVVLKHHGEPVAMVNLATLFSWATAGRA